MGDVSRRAVGGQRAQIVGSILRRLAYRIQELAYGGLSQGAIKQLKAVADGRPVATTKPRKRGKIDLAPGTRLLREWHGDRYEVIVEADGFRYAGKTYRSLSAVARAISGSHVSGNSFFGLVPRKH
ncbi:MAG: hypothetical protein CMJ49_08940 [Planctomycetaceae bacterium]|nr:hypothetical protein [Planctomycetaceae bacterium]